MTAEVEMRASILWKEFGVKIGFHPIVADVLHELSYAYSVADAFTRRLLPHWRGDFEEIERTLIFGGKIEVVGELAGDLVGV